MVARFGHLWMYAAKLKDDRSMRFLRFMRALSTSLQDTRSVELRVILPNELGAVLLDNSSVTVHPIRVSLTTF